MTVATFGVLREQEEKTVIVIGSCTAVRLVCEKIAEDPFLYGVTSFEMLPPTSDWQELSVTYLSPSNFESLVTQSGARLKD